MGIWTRIWVLVENLEENMGFGQEYGFWTRIWVLVENMGIWTRIWGFGQEYGFWLRIWKRIWDLDKNMGFS